ncbi:divergent polysaccharide deacetylase family protein [Methyloraptor flagellatus]|uniref:Divergent polysaccharide deacetylase family protein n=1 Tax=Methyloraptor flagellatus TaxID=3162530 RepID=A0AAU7X9C7_9HYPH
MARDLNEPLGTAKRFSGWKRVPYGVIGLSIVALVAMIGGVWIALVKDPLGGEPMAVVRVDRGRTGIGPSDVGVKDMPDRTRKPAAAAHGGAETASEATGGEHAAAPAGAEAKAEAGAPSGQLALDPEDAARRAPEVVEGQPLTTTPVARVSDKGRYGILPKVAADGTRPLEVYARPAPRRPSSQPKVVMIVGGLGLSQTATQEALRQLPGGITLGFAPYGGSLDRWVARARQDGHELLLQIPMEPFDYPDNDPGPHTLLAGGPVEQNPDKVQWLLSRVTNYVGVMNYMGGKYTATETALEPFLKEIGTRGLMYLDDGTSSRSVAVQVSRKTRTPFARADVVVDQVATDAGIDARLAQLEQLARTNGSAIGVASALPITVKKLAEWAKSLDSRGLVLVPVSSLARFAG